MLQQTAVQCEDESVEKDRHRSGTGPTKSLVQSPAVTDDHGTDILAGWNSAMSAPCFSSLQAGCQKVVSLLFFVNFTKLFHLARNTVGTWVSSFPDIYLKYDYRVTCLWCSCIIHPALHLSLCLFFPIKSIQSSEKYWDQSNKLKVTRSLLFLGKYLVFSAEAVTLNLDSLRFLLWVSE